MNREYKFRAWDKFNGQYWYSDKYINLAEYFGAMQSLMDGGNVLKFQEYTGLKDKKGVEIYEGDFIQHPAYYETPEMSSNPLAHDFIIYKDGAFRFNDGEGLLFEEMENYDGDFEILGNLYQHPELINKNS
jgi:hypothetical protein